METLLGIIIFFFGTIIGSFLNVVIYRFNTGRTLGGRSMCFSCGKTLHWHELVPLASYIFQDGKCTKCKSKISGQYPLVEAITGFMFVFVAFKFAYLLPASMTLFLVLVTFSAYLWCLLIVISVYDFKHKIIPDRLVWTFIVISLIGIFVFKGDAVVLHLPTLFDLASGPLLAMPFFLLWFFSKGRAMGLGDAKLMLGVGYFLGLSIGVVGMILAFWIGAIVSIYLLIINGKKYSMKAEIPFGPFLVIGAFIAYIFSITFPLFLTLFQ